MSARPILFIALSLAFLSLVACGDRSHEPDAASDAPVAFDAPADARPPGIPGFREAVTAGYQGWFAAPGDGSPVDRWVHWAVGQPAPGNVTFELYPDTRDYAPEDLFATGLGALPGGGEARLFSSYRSGVIDTHFRWMAEYGIDGVGLQRFVSELNGGPFEANRTAIADRVRTAAETHGRIFYIMYDVSGADASTLLTELQTDWQEVMEAQLDITNSDHYARQDGRPVVALWGFGFAGRPVTQEQAMAIVSWFQGRGLYVVGGVPYYWRTGTNDSDPGWDAVYQQFDMIQPWSVGRFATDQDLDAHYVDVMQGDMAFCQQNGIDYQRVIFPGFAWSNWNGGPRNQIPRRAGALFWRQAYYATLLGASGYIAMFDEYDEATAIAKAAENATMIPSDQYFLTLDADGQTVSADFYLRLAGAATRMLRGEAPLRDDVPIPLIP